MKPRAVPIALGFALVVLAACSAAPSPPTTVSPTTTRLPASAPTAQRAEPTSGLASTPVKINVVGSVAEGPMYYATERGYFAEQGISPQFITFDSAQQAIPSLSTGQIDVGQGPLSAGLFNAINRGIDVRLVAPQSENRGCAHSSNWILVRKDLADSGAVRTPADLRGRRIAVTSKGSTSEYLMDVLLHQGNLQASDVEYVEMSFGAMGAAFAGRTIDVAVNGEPTATSAVDQGLATKWVCGADIVPNLQFTYLLYSPQFADQHTELAQRWMAAYLRDAREWQTMLETGEDKDAKLSVLAKYTPVKDLALLERATLPVPAAEARIDVANISNQIAWMRERGYVTDAPSLDRFVDTRFVQQAGQVPAGS